MPGGASIDLERIVDDFVLFCMLIGNDFLPGRCGLEVRTEHHKAAAVQKQNLDLITCTAH